MVQINFFDGYITGSTAHDSLVKKFGCNDKRISIYNVLKIKAPPNFERHFVFYIDDSEMSIKKNIQLGETRLDKFIQVIKNLIKILTTEDEYLHGQIAEIKPMKTPETNLVTI